MAIIVRNLVPEFLRFWQRAAGQDEQRQLALWHEYVELCPEVINDLRRSRRTPDPLQALKLYPTTVVERIEANAEAGTGWVQDAADLVVPVLDAAHLDLQAVVMVGVGTSNGWVSQFRGPTLFLAVEQIPDTATRPARGAGGRPGLRGRRGRRAVSVSQP